MNCMEAQSLVEDALDDSLTESRKRALDLHLSRCDDCRAFFASERDEHRRWFQAMNGHEALRRVPDGFSERFLSEIAKRHAVPQRKWALVRALRQIAAVLAAMLLFAGLSYAAVTAVEEMRGMSAANGDDLTEDQESEGVNRDAEGGETVERVVLNVPDSLDTYQLPTAKYQHETNQGDSKSMTRRKAAAAALTAAMAAASLVRANGDEYQFIVSGELVAATEGCSSDSSSTTSLESGPLADGFVYGDELEARYRTMGESDTCSLRSDKAGFIISFR